MLDDMVSQKRRGSAAAEGRPDVAAYFELTFSDEAAFDETRNRAAP